ncbi:Putative protein [Zobellia galactanivorans]|uniref:Uncharacterized protein n=1 Tax=Zobellia galactanivorans (strain DSM 12802 / CCUG 47099 / CIP 106680 / NCIMB 13871 / Dsij) TaxID=63186 RepID=G0L0H7_ZOBGA|nr:Putative protein [Zobellia galactanivorans]
MRSLMSRLKIRVQINISFKRHSAFIPQLVGQLLYKLRLKRERLQGEQGHAPLGDCLQPEKVPEIHGKTFKKRGGKLCFAAHRKKLVPST